MRATLAITLMLAAGIVQAAPILTVRGVTPEAETNIRAFAALSREPCELPEWRESAVLRYAANSAARALRALGWYEPQISANLVRAEGCWILSLDIVPGEAVIVTETDLRLDGAAAGNESFTALFASPPLQPGEQLHHGRYDDFVLTALRLAQDLGYFDAQFTRRELRVHIAERRARLVLHFDSGNRYRIGDLRIEQNFLDDDFVARLHSLTPDTPYSSAEIHALRRELLDSGYFDEVRLRVRPEEASDHAVPVDIDLIPRPRRAWYSGIGYATDIGPRLRLGHENRRVNRRGHRLNAEIELSPVRNGLGLTYEIPLEDPRTSRLILSGAFRNEETSTAESDLLRLGATRQDRLPSGWTLSRGLDFERENFTVGDDTGSTNLLIPSIGLGRVQAEDAVFARNGWRLDLRLRGALEGAGSDLSFAQGEVRGTWLTPAGEGRLILRGGVGLSWTDDLRDLPASVRFFAGGDTSVRGYGYQKLGPRDADGLAIGGRHLLTTSVEYERLVRGQFSVAVFADAGNAFNAYDGLATSVGVGLRWHSPIGTLRIDVAHPFDTDDSYRIHIGIGTMP